MKRYILCLLFLPLLSRSQSLIGGNNIIKANLTAYALGNFGLTYERHIAPHLTLSLGINKMPNRSLPFMNEIKDKFSSSYINYENSSVSNLSITPELRFYILGGMRGFYLAPYARYTSMNLHVPLHYSTIINGNTVKEDATFSGTITSTSGGLMIGTQHQLFKKVVIDIWIVGAHYGSCSGDLNATYKPTNPNNSTITSEEKSTLQSAINSINPSPFNVSGKVNPTAPTAEIKVSGPWAGIRALGINVGIRF
jgi:hypothetical protein